MKKIGIYILLIVFLMFIIPVIILGGIGPGIKIPEIINKYVGMDQGTYKYNDENGGPKIKVFNEDKGKIEEMYLEEYIVGVLSAEMPASFEVEALKAQAVAARTFAAANMSIAGGGG